MPVGTTLATVAAVASAGIGAYGAIQSSNAQASSAKYASQVALDNAKIAEQNSQWAAAEGNQKTEAAELATRAKVGGILANQGASGVDISSGSSTDVRTSAAETGQLSAINIRAAATRQAYGYETQAAGDTAQAGVDQASAANDKSAGIINAAGDVLGGVSEASKNTTLLGSDAPDGNAWGAYTDSKGISWNAWGQ